MSELVTVHCKAQPGTVLVVRQQDGVVSSQSVAFPSSEIPKAFWEAWKEQNAAIVEHCIVSEQSFGEPEKLPVVD